MQNQGCRAQINSRQSFCDHRSSFVQHAISTHLEILKQHAINKNQKGVKRKWGKECVMQPNCKLNFLRIK